MNNCPYCEQKTQFKDYLKHIEICYEEKEQRFFPCEVCLQVLNNNNYIDHMYSHYELGDIELIQVSQLAHQQSSNSAISHQQSSNSAIQNMTNEQTYEYFTNLDQNIKQGFSQKELSKLNLIEFKQKTKEDCQICKEEFVLRQELVLLKCLHKFHKECIVKWFEYKKFCPQCKQQEIL